MIKETGDYYLYRHVRLDKNEPFYIGIAGKKADKGEYYYRGNRVSNRNRIWKNIYNACGHKIEIQILLESDSFLFIKEKEKEFIYLYGRRNNKTGILANMTDGGDGTCGTVATPQTRKNQSVAQINSSKTLKKGTKLPDWWVDKIREKKMGKMNPMYGKHTPISKKVINVETLEIFESILLAGKSYGLKDRLLHQYLSGHRLNKSPFVYYDLYNQIGVDKCNKLINKISLPNKSNSKKVIDTSNGKKYESAKKAADAVGYSSVYLRRMLTGNKENKTKLRYA